MKTPSLDNFYSLINKNILLAQAYTEISDLSFIIKSCRLKPYEYLSEKDNKTKLYRWWVDEHNNSLKVVKKELDIVYNDLSIDRNKIINTDLYYGLSMDKIIKMSKYLHIFVGKDDKEEIIITLLGIDNYFRSYLYSYGNWQQVSPLILGIKRLSIIRRNMDVRDFKELKIMEDCYSPCESKVEWLSFIPMSDNFRDVIKKNDSLLFLI